MKGRLKAMRRYLFLMVFVISIDAYALDDASYANGWYWGKDEVNTENKQKNTKQLQNKKSILKPKTNAEILDEINSQSKEMLATSILNPSVKNIGDYVEMQNKVTSIAANFEKGWIKTMLARPELDYGVKHPSNNYARQIVTSTKNSNIKQAITTFSTKYGLMYFFKGIDKLAEFQSKIISTFAKRNNIAIVAASIDGNPNQYFPNAKVDNGAANRLGVTVTPAILARNIVTGEIKPIGFGIVSEFELEERIYKFLEGEL